MSVNSIPPPSYRRRIFAEDDPSALRLGAVNIFPTFFGMMEKTLKPDEFPLNDRYATAYERVISIIIYRLERCDTKLLVEISRFGMIQVISAVVYSLETPNIYKDLNYFTRNISFGPTLLQFSQSPLYKDYPSTTRLFCDLYSMEWKSTTTVEKTLYRGVSLPFQGEVGDTLSLMQFTSASTDRNVALNFLLQLPGTQGDLILVNCY